jgi:hypothetical protein
MVSKRVLTYPQLLHGFDKLLKFEIELRFLLSLVNLSYINVPPNATYDAYPPIEL